MRGKLSIQLDEPDRSDRHDESLGDLLAAAAAVIRPSCNLTDREAKREARLIAHWAVRSVCQEIIRAGKLPLPLRVFFAGGVIPGPDDFSRN